MPVKTIGRDKIRGKHLDSDCYNATFPGMSMGLMTRVFIAMGLKI